MARHSCHKHRNQDGARKRNEKRSEAAPIGNCANITISNCRHRYYDEPYCVPDVYVRVIADFLFDFVPVDGVIVRPLEDLEDACE